MTPHGGVLRGGPSSLQVQPRQGARHLKMLAGQAGLSAHGWVQRWGWEGQPPACIRVGLALFKRSRSSCKLLNTYFGRSAWPEARALHYSCDISLNKLQSVHSWLSLVSTTELASSPLQKDCLAPDGLLGRNSSTIGGHCLEPLLCSHLAYTGGGCLALLFRCKFP